MSGQSQTSTQIKLNKAENITMPHFLYNILALWYRTPPENAIVTSLPQDISCLYANQKFSTVVTKSSMGPALNQSNAVHVSTPFCSNILHMPKWFLHFSFSGQNSVCVSHFLRVTRLPHLLLELLS